MTAVKIAVAISILLFLLLVAYSLVFINITGPPAPTELRELGKAYLTYVMGVSNETLSAASPETLAAILWDYRGVDTLYETMVLFAAIIGALSIYREYMGEKGRAGDGVSSMSAVVRAVSKLVVWVTALLAVVFGLTGQLTPGGGFVGGSTFAVIPILLTLVFYSGFIESLGITRQRALVARATALMTLAIIALIPLAFGGYVFQNQLKPGTDFSYPPRFLDGTPLGGSILFFNIAETVSVAAAFALSLIILGYVAAEELVGESREA